MGGKYEYRQHFTKKGSLNRPQILKDSQSH